MSPRRSVQPQPARSDEQRERDRAERERRRGAEPPPTVERAQSSRDERIDAGRQAPFALSADDWMDADAHPTEPQEPVAPAGAYVPPLPPPDPDASRRASTPQPRPAARAPAAAAGGGRSAAGRGGRGGRRPWLSRALAVLALAAIVLAVGLAVQRLTNRRHVKALAAPVVVKVLIPEGESRLQIAGRAHAAGLTGSYLSASKRSPLLDPAHYGAPAGTPNLEGFLFPATYDLYRGDPAGRLVREQLVAFDENFGDAETRRAHDLHLTPYQLLIVASIIEREAQLAGDRAKVAAVIYNRLRLGMALGVDSTLRYALNDYTQPLTRAQLALDSPYNTRLHKGLPPTPISNPGLAAIDAAAHPAHVGYLYYVAGADGCGEQVFSTSFAQFERDAAAYHQALQDNGGRVPSCHKKP